VFRLARANNSEIDLMYMVTLGFDSEGGNKDGLNVSREQERGKRKGSG
jgi:hypothetical protein